MLEHDRIPPKYSVVVPLHDEQESVRELYRRLCEVMTGRYEPVEFVFVDDHSVDGTLQLLAEIAEFDPRVVVLRLKRNYGQTVALAAGFDYASGDIILSMDGDLQHDPADIPLLLDTLESADCDIVSGWRQKRVDNFFLRRLPSRIANWMMAKLSGVDIHDFGTTFKVYRRDTIKDVRLYGELHRFIPALAAWNGAKVVEVPISNIVRPGGRSHYGISRTFRVFFDLITVRFLMRYMTRPLHFFGPAGLLGLAGGAFILLFLLFEKLFYGINLFAQHGPLLVLGMMLCLFGLQLLAVGLVGELIMRTYFEAHQKPVYRIERVMGAAHLTGMPR
ncbi:MAG TPA: glycosyltransferase family 2 protein [Candidatus Acidoferrales bacterium]|jgi:glycosyltransferase involved in cell wall biosynthesis|nr:glycosyltransferase family 2 protein [Candidatus Acidoferrales bacterium]